MANPTFFREDYSAIEDITKRANLLCLPKTRIKKALVFAVQLARNKKPDQLGRLKVVLTSISFVDGEV